MATPAPSIDVQRTEVENVLSLMDAYSYAAPEHEPLVPEPEQRQPQTEAEPVAPAAPLLLVPPTPPAPVPYTARAPLAVLAVGSLVGALRLTRGRRTASS